MTDITRVSAFKMSRDVSGRVLPESGVKTPFHSCSHHGENPREDRGVRQAQPLSRQPGAVFPGEAEEHAGRRRQPAGSFAWSCTAAPWAIRTCTITSACRCSWRHANGQLKGNLHVRHQDGTPMANVLLTMLHKLGVNVDKLRRQHRRNRDLRRLSCWLELWPRAALGAAFARHRYAPGRRGHAGRQGRRAVAAETDSADVNARAGRRQPPRCTGPRSTTIWRWRRCCSPPGANVKAATRDGAITPLFMACTNGNARHDRSAAESRARTRIPSKANGTTRADDGRRLRQRRRRESAARSRRRRQCEGSALTGRPR